MPTGCGEQTMLGLAPDVFVTNYLSATKQLSSDIEEKAINYMEKGTNFTNVLTPKIIKWKGKLSKKIPHWEQFQSPVQKWYK